MTPPEKVRYDACVTVDAGFEPQADVGIQTIPGGVFAVATHIGPWSTLGETYVGLLGRFLPSSGRELRGDPALEIYLTDPENTDPEDMLTEIWAPLEPARRG